MFFCRFLDGLLSQCISSCVFLTAPNSFLPKAISAASGVPPIDPPRAKSAWARLIRKVYEADPLECPKCHGPMRIIAPINDPAVVRRILEHLGLWQPQAMERQPPSDAWPLNSILTRN